MVVYYNNLMEQKCISDGQIKTVKIRESSRMSLTRECSAQKDRVVRNIVVSSGVYLLIIFSILQVSCEAFQSHKLGKSSMSYLVFLSLFLTLRKT